MLLPALCHLPVLPARLRRICTASPLIERLCEDLKFLLHRLTHFEPGAKLLISPSLYEQLGRRQDPLLLRLQEPAGVLWRFSIGGEVEFRVCRMLC